MKNILVLFLVVPFLLLYNCEDAPNYTDASNTAAPAPVTNPKVENINGGAIITYNLPEGNDLLGVKAVYALRDSGEILEMFSSAHRDTIELNGFADTKERSITLITINNSFIESSPLEVSIKPLTPPVDLIRESLNVVPSFGGVYASWTNLYKENIAVSLLFEDSQGFLTEDDTHYSASKEGGFAFRGFESKITNFRITIRDRWGNFAEPLNFSLTPFFEEEILAYDPSNSTKPLWDIAYGAFDGTREWRGGFVLPGGGGWNSMLSGARMTWGIVIDGETDVYNNRWGLIYKPRLSDYFPDAEEDLTYLHPTYFIFDLQGEVIPSRFKFWAMWLAETFPNEIEVWGTNSIPKSPNDFDDITESLNYWTEWKVPPYIDGADTWKNEWIKLGDVKVRPTPSGAFQDGDFTPEDIERRDRGYEVEVNPDVVGTKVRYLRFVYKDVSHEQCYTTNIKIWGQYAN